MKPSQLEDFEAFLESHAIVWSRLDRRDRFLAIRQWTSIFGNAFVQGMRYKEGDRARRAFSQVDNADFFLLSVANESPRWTSSQPGPKWGYTCKAPIIPDLSQFAFLDFAVVAGDFTWTMVYTHEDDVLGGPYFAEKNWVT